MVNIIARWTDEQVERLKDLWAQRVSGTMIALRLGVTRSAVHGKVHRLGLSGRKSYAPPLTRFERNTRRTMARHAGLIPRWKPSEPVQAKPVQKPIKLEPLNIGLLKLKSSHCRYVTGKGTDGLATYCGHDILDRSFCAQHYKLCYSKVPMRRA